jgi:hypothetical protein
VGPNPIFVSKSLPLISKTQMYGKKSKHISHVKWVTIAKSKQSKTSNTPTIKRRFLAGKLHQEPIKVINTMKEEKSDLGQTE